VKRFSEFIVRSLVAGALVIAPLYLASLLLLKVAKSLTFLEHPFAQLFPKWVFVGRLFSLLLTLVLCVIVGIAVRTSPGRAVWDRVDHSLFERIPSYAVFRSLTQRLAGQEREETWKPALAEIDKALVPAFIIEEIDESRFAVFVPSVPTPLAGSIYILTRDRVHPLDIPFTKAIKVIYRWGSGSRDLVAAMDKVSR
jgi:uncharacterized membrane protein